SPPPLLSFPTRRSSDLGIHPQKQAGLVYVGASVLRGRITPQQLRTAADLADRFADGHLRTTIMQNLLIANVPQQHAATVAQELRSEEHTSELQSLTNLL